MLQITINFATSHDHEVQIVGNDVEEVKKAVEELKKLGEEDNGES